MLRRSTSTIFFEDNIFSLGDREVPCTSPEPSPSPAPRDCGSDADIPITLPPAPDGGFRVRTQYVTATPVKAVGRTTQQNRGTLARSPTTLNEFTGNGIFTLIPQLLFR